MIRLIKVIAMILIVWTMILEQHLINHLNQKNHSSDFLLQKLQHHAPKHPTFFGMIAQKPLGKFTKALDIHGDRMIAESFNFFADDGFSVVEFFGGYSADAGYFFVDGF